MQGIGQICTTLGTFLLLSAPLATFAQPSDVDIGPDDDQIEEIIVTGSRIKRSTYTSIAPLQIIDAQDAREVGQVDTATVLQDSIAATGFQDDLHAVGFVTENGPGAANVSLRGLGNARTLVLINGRRMAPAGVEGAPIAADLNLVPSLFVQQYDMLLDGASSIYGSDAVAGVVNVILRNDFDGFEAEFHSGLPEQGGGLSNAMSFAWGKTTERGSIGFGVEHHELDSVTVDQRRWTNQCTRHVEVDVSGEFHHLGVRNQFREGMPASECVEQWWWWAGTLEVQHFTALLGTVDPGPIGIFPTPGFSNTGIPNYSDSNHVYLFGGIDGNGDGVTDISYSDYSFNGLDDNHQLTPEFERTSAMLYGDYQISAERQLETYFELQFGERKTRGDSGVSVFNAIVPAANPYNPCNPDGLNGVDCVLAWNDFWQQQSVIDMVVEQFGFTPQDAGLGQNAPYGATRVGAYIAIPGDRTFVESEVSQTRAVAGLRGDLSETGRWYFDAGLQYSRSEGTSSRPGIRMDRMDQSLETSMIDPASGDIVCGEDSTGDGIPDGFNADGQRCVPIDLFAPSLFENVLGQFSTQEQHDYLFDTRDFDTTYEQLQFTAFVGGELFETTAGSVDGILGVEYRQDSIESIPNDIARNGLFRWFEGDAGAIGERSTRELFFEIEAPLLSDYSLAQELTTNLSARHVRDEYFGSHTTYSAKIGWRPVDGLLLRGTYGTSFRAPNLRENFLTNLTSQTNIFDPCIPPDEAFDFAGEYLPEFDGRPDYIKTNCANDGIDPAAWYYGSWQGAQITVDGSGRTDLVAETSDSLSYGFVWNLSLGDASSLTVGTTYYEIDVADTILKPSAGFIVNDCYNSPDLISVLCDRISRDPVRQYIDRVNTDFINREEYLASGYDINLSLGTAFTAAAQPVDLAIDLVLNHPTEASETYRDVLGNVDYDDQAGQWGYPDWQGTLTVGASIRDFRFTWRTKMIGAVHQDPLSVEDWSDVTDWTGSDTCHGPTFGELRCRDVGFADDYFVHSTSVFYYGDSFTIGAGVRNVFDEAPPLVDPSEVQSVRNVPLGYGYDMNGRTFFANLSASFD